MSFAVLVAGTKQRASVSITTRIGSAGSCLKSLRVNDRIEG